MKILILIRHAKSSWAEQHMDDRDRPLNERGKEDAPEMAKRLKQRIKSIDLFAASPAVRARKTAAYFATAYDLKKDDVTIFPALYPGSTGDYLQTVAGLSNEHKIVALCAHNPGITEFANMLANVHVDDMPTCSIFAVQSDVSAWKDFAGAEKQFLFFDYPKNPLLR